MNIDLKKEWDNWLSLQPFIKLKDSLAYSKSFMSILGNSVDLKFNSVVAKKYNVKFLEQFATDMGIATVIGTDPYYNNLWFMLERENKVRYWPDLDDDIKLTKIDRFVPINSIEANYPNEILEMLNAYEISVKKIPLLQQIINEADKLIINFPKLLQVRDRLNDSGICFISKDNDVVRLKFNNEVSEKYNIKFLDQFEVDACKATVVGADKENLWFIVNDDVGISCWPKIQSDIRTISSPKFKLISSEDITYPEYLLDFFKNNYGINENEIKYLREIVNRNKEKKLESDFLKFFPNIDRGLFDEFTSFEINLRNAFVNTPLTFLKDLEKLFLCIQDYIAIKKIFTSTNLFNPKGQEYLNNIKHLLEYEFDKIYALTTVVKNQTFTNINPNNFLDPLNAMANMFSNQLRQLEIYNNKFLGNLSHIEDMVSKDFEMKMEVINFLINTVKDFEIDFSEMTSHFIEVYSKITSIVGELIYHHDVVEDGKDKYIIALMYFILSGNEDSIIEIFKKSCHLQLLEEKLQPVEYHPEIYCKKEPKKFIDFYDLVLKSIEQMSLAVKNHPHLFLEKAKLHYFASEAYKINNEVNKEKATRVYAKINLIRVFKLYPEIGLSFAEKYFQDDFNINVLLGYYYFSKNSESNWEKYLNQATKSVNMNSKNKKYIFLLLKSKDENNREIGIQYLSKFVKTLNISRIQFFKEKAETNIEIYFSLAKAVLLGVGAVSDQRVNSVIKDHLNNCAIVCINLFLEKNPNNPYANYLKYQIKKYLLDIFDCDSLTFSARLGCEDAIEELHSCDNKLAKYELGMMYLEGEGVAQDYVLAERYLILSDTYKAILQLAKMRLDRNINIDETDYDIIKKLNSLLLSGSNFENRSEILNLVKELSEDPNYRIDALLVLAENLVGNPELAAPYYQEYHQSRPEDIFPLLSAINTSNILAYFNDELLKSVITKIFELKQNEFILEFSLQNIGDEIKKRKNPALNIVLLKYPELHQKINDQDLITILDGSKPILSADSLVNCLITRKPPQIIFDWLYKNLDFLPNILVDKSLMDKLDRIPEWQEFFNTYHVQRIVSTSPVLSNDPKPIYLPHHFWNKVSTASVIDKLKKNAEKSEHSLLVQDKLKVYEELNAKKIELTDVAPSEESNDEKEKKSNVKITFFAQLNEKFNAVASRGDLDKLIKEASEDDPEFYKKLISVLHVSNQ